MPDPREFVHVFKIWFLDNHCLEFPFIMVWACIINRMCQKKRVKRWNNRYVCRDPCVMTVSANSSYLPEIFRQFTSMRNIWALWVNIQWCFCAKKNEWKVEINVIMRRDQFRPYVMTGFKSRLMFSNFPSKSLLWL